MAIALNGSASIRARQQPDERFTRHVGVHGQGPRKNRERIDANVHSASTDAAMPESAPVGGGAGRS